MANTNILIKRSLTTGRPTSLAAGEFAYSYSSNTLYIGSPTGNGVVNVGGQYYTSTLDAATAANTASTLVKRDINGAFAGRLTGIADKADILTNARNFSISGTDITASAQSFDGSAAITLNAALNAVPGLSAGFYGGSSTGSSVIPVVQVAANGRIMSIANTTVTSSFTISDGSATDVVNSGETLTFTGTKGITTAVTNNLLTISTDNTIVRSNTASDNQTINSSLSINGNLTVLGTQTYINTNTLNVADPLIYLAANNSTSDIVDIGFAGRYFDGATVRQTGVFRDAGNKEYYIFDNYTPGLGANNDINVADGSFNKANVNASYFKGNVIATTISSGALSLTTALPVTSGGTGQSSFSTGQVVIGSGTNGLAQLANVSSINTSITSNSTVNNITTDVYGRVTNYTTQAISGLTVAQGGTGVATFSSGGLLIGNGTGAVNQLANTTYVLTGALSAAKTITSLTVDAYGRVTAATGADINIDTSQIGSGTLGYARGGTGATSYTTGTLLVAGVSGLTSLANTTYTVTGTPAANNTVTSMTVDAYGRTTAKTYAAISGLTVGQGGTGASSFTTNGITYGNGTGAIQVTAAAGTSDQTWSNQVLTTTNAGVPVWTTALDGGTF
jgi:hypothetical protein